MPSAGALSYLTVRPPESLSYGAPEVDFSWLSKLPQQYQQGQQYARTRQLQTAFDQGLPRNPDGSINTGAITDTLFRLGGAEAAAPIAQKLIGADLYRQMMGGQGGGQLSSLDQSQQQAQPTSGGSSVDPRGMIPRAVASAQKYGVDPNRFVAMLRSEGLGNFHGDYENGRPTSFGASQLHFGGRSKGLGDEFYAETGLDPRDPNNESAMIDWSAKNLARTGWKPYNGATKIGLRGFDGISRGGAPTQTAAAGGGGPATGAPAPVEQPPGAMGTPPFMGTQETGGTGPAASNVGSGPANIQLASTSPDTLVNQGAQPAAPAAPAEQPVQIAQAQPQPSNIPSARYTPEAADRLDQAAAALRRSAGALSASGFPAETAKAQLDQAENLNKQAAEIRSFLAKRSESEYGVGIKGREEQNKADIAQYSGLHKGLAGAGMVAANGVQYGQAAQGLINDPGFYSGSGEQVNLAYKRALAGLGINPGAALPQEAFRKVMAANILQQVNGLKAEAEAMGEKGGRIFASQIDLMEKAAQNPDNSIAANRYLTEIFLRGSQRTLTIADKADDYKAKHGALDAGFEKEIRNWIVKNPILTPKEMANPHLVGAPKSQQQAPSQPAPSAPAIQYLQQNPATRALFDAKYGKGAAARALGEGT